ncbi:GspH/FimT family protein [Candidatus Thiothrix anitrata]|uniref:Type II secretion system protein H n=1 Tax=Candidatus Thiothrix anitrata TaxID=2823902 RepID=A0ABX7X937_9GAMM|nr:GspH/FimT family protein [Candidatus Thiothrix anitrata]QTR51734.1 GspH/FimT family protein [Candidatus Thiothrix anitrata]
MMTSVAGGWNVKPRHTLGFSLIEMLVVLMVVGVLYAMAGSLVNLTMADPLRDEVERLGGRISLLQDEALVRSQPLAIGMDTRGYHFFECDEQANCTPLTEDGLFKAHAFPSGYKQGLVLQGVDVALDKSRPQIFVLPGGEMTSFEWRLRAANGQSRGIRVDTRGQLVALPLEGY